jgi:hypothetical protein
VNSNYTESKYPNWKSSRRLPLRDCRFDRLKLELVSCWQLVVEVRVLQEVALSREGVDGRVRRRSVGVRKGRVMLKVIDWLERRVIGSCVIVMLFGVRERLCNEDYFAEELELNVEKVNGRLWVVADTAWLVV